MFPGSDILLVTDRLRLRRLRPDDSQRLWELDSDPEVMRYISKGKATPLEKIEREIMPRLLAWYAQSPPQGFWAAHLVADDTFAGWFHLRPDRISPPEMELGYRLKRAVWGMGLATEGSRALVRRAFTEWGYENISARTLIGNLASRRVMEKVGLRFECFFEWSENVLPGWTAEERRGVKYSLARAAVTQT